MVLTTNFIDLVCLVECKELLIFVNTKDLKLITFKSDYMVDIKYREGFFQTQKSKVCIFV